VRSSRDNCYPHSVSGSEIGRLGMIRRNDEGDGEIGVSFIFKKFDGVRISSVCALLLAPGKIDVFSNLEDRKNRDFSLHVLGNFEIRESRLPDPIKVTRKPE